MSSIDLVYPRKGRFNFLFYLLVSLRKGFLQATSNNKNVANHNVASESSPTLPQTAQSTSTNPSSQPLQSNCFAIPLLKFLVAV